MEPKNQSAGNGSNPPNDENTSQENAPLERTETEKWREYFQRNYWLTSSLVSERGKGIIPGLNRCKEAAIKARDMTRKEAAEADLPNLEPFREKKIAEQWAQAENEAKEVAKICRERREDIEAFSRLAAEYRRLVKEANA